jgi:hypothetical protein
MYIYYVLLLKCDKIFALKEENEMILFFFDPDIIMKIIPHKQNHAYHMEMKGEVVIRCDALIMDTLRHIRRRNSLEFVM